MLEELTQGYDGAFKVQVAGPWTLAATVEKPRGDKVLSDHGARRELAQALAEGVRGHVRDVRRRLDDRGSTSRLVVQVDEPALAAVLGGGVPTASGFGRHRTVHPPEASEHLGWVLAAIAEEGAEPWVHACAAGTPLDLLRGAGARGLAVDLDVLDAAGHDALAEALEAGERVVLGVVPTRDAGAGDHDRHRGRRARAAVARHARPRPRDGRPAARRLAGLRTGRRLGRVGPPGAAAARAAAGHLLRPASGLPAAHLHLTRVGTRCGAALVGAAVRSSGQPAWAGAPSGPSVASSSCLTLSRVQITSEAPSIMIEPMRNAWVAPSVKVAWKTAEPNQSCRDARCRPRRWRGPGRSARRPRRRGC